MADRTPIQRWARIMTYLVSVVALVVVSVTWYQRNASVEPSGVSVVAPEILVTAPETERTIETVPFDENVFYPQERSLTDCTGFVERPGCGSEARGGTAQTILALVLFAALGLIGWRIFRGVRRRPA